MESKFMFFSMGIIGYLIGMGTMFVISNKLESESAYEIQKRQYNELVDMTDELKEYNESMEYELKKYRQK